MHGCACVARLGAGGEVLPVGCKAWCRVANNDLLPCVRPFALARTTSSNSRRDCFQSSTHPQRMKRQDKDGPIPGRVFAQGGSARQTKCVKHLQIPRFSTGLHRIAPLVFCSPRRSRTRPATPKTRRAMDGAFAAFCFCCCVCGHLMKPAPKHEHLAD